MGYGARAEPRPVQHRPDRRGPWRGLGAVRFRCARRVIITGAGAASGTGRGCGARSVPSAC